MNEEAMSALTPAQLRLSHAEYFLAQYRKHSGPPIDSYWLMVGYFDAYLFALGSVWDMSPNDVQEELNKSRVFQFFKALRNITTHHSVLSVHVGGNKFPRPLSRIVNATLGGPQQDSSRLFFRLDVLRQILDAVEAEWKPAKKNIDAARVYIAELEARSGQIFLDDLMLEAIEAVRAVIPAPSTSN